MIHITDAIAIEEREVEESFLRASGPGGQNANKLSTAVRLRFDVRRSPSLPENVRARVERLAARRLTQEAVLIIIAQRHRTQERNRKDALERLVEHPERGDQDPLSLLLAHRPPQPCRITHPRPLRCRQLMAKTEPGLLLVRVGF